MSASRIILKNSPARDMVISAIARDLHSRMQERAEFMGITGPAFLAAAVEAALQPCGGDGEGGLDRQVHIAMALEASSYAVTDIARATGLSLLTAQSIVNCYRAEIGRAIVAGTPK